MYLRMCVYIHVYILPESLFLLFFLFQRKHKTIATKTTTAIIDTVVATETTITINILESSSSSFGALVLVASGDDPSVGISSVTTRKVMYMYIMHVRGYSVSYTMK